MRLAYCGSGTPVPTFEKPVVPGSPVLLANRPSPTPEVSSPSAVAPARPKKVVRAASPRRAASRRSGSPWECDAELVSAILSGSGQHFDMLYEAYFPRVYRFALKRLRDPSEAEDVTQEVFVTVYRALDSYQGNSSLLVWIFGITRNKVNRRFRGFRPRFESIEADDSCQLAAAEVPTDRAVDARRMLQRCERLIATELTPLQRRIFHLKHLRRQSIRTIAGALGKSEDAVKANLYRMRRTIAQAAPDLDQILSA